MPPSLSPIRVSLFPFSLEPQLLPLRLENLSPLDSHRCELNFAQPLSSQSFPHSPRGGVPNFYLQPIQQYTSDIPKHISRISKEEHSNDYLFRS